MSLIFTMKLMFGAPTKKIWDSNLCDN